MSDRAGYITGLRMLADLLEQHPDLPLPYDGSSPAHGRISVFCDHRKQVAQFARLLPGRVSKHVDPGSPSYGFRLQGALAGLHIDVMTDRDEVCERIVVGTETVTQKVPDPSVQVPLVEVTKTVETVTWRCSPLLSDVDIPAVTG